MWFDGSSICFLEATAVKTWYGVSDTQQHVGDTRHQNEECLQINVCGINADSSGSDTLFKMAR